jgi:hypothetical protein
MFETFSCMDTDGDGNLLSICQRYIVLKIYYYSLLSLGSLSFEDLRKAVQEHCKEPVDGNVMSFEISAHNQFPNTNSL